MRILFVCKHNMFRSKIAEIYFNKINKNKSDKAESAGVIRGYFPLNKRQVSIAKEFNIDLKGRPRGLSIDLIKKQNLIIIVADDVPKSLFNRKGYINLLFNRKEHINFKATKIIKWNIPDNPKATNKAKLRKIIKLIIEKDEQLNKQLNKNEK